MEVGISKVQSGATLALLQYLENCCQRFHTEAVRTDEMCGGVLGYGFASTFLISLLWERKWNRSPPDQNLQGATPHPWLPRTYLLKKHYLLNWIWCGGSGNSPFWVTGKLWTRSYSSKTPPPRPKVQRSQIATPLQSPLWLGALGPLDSHWVPPRHPLPFGTGWGGLSPLFLQESRDFPALLTLPRPYLCLVPC